MLTQPDDRASFKSRLAAGLLSLVALTALGALAVSSLRQDEYMPPRWPSDYVVQEGLLRRADNIVTPRSGGTSRSSGTPEMRFVRFRLEGHEAEFTTWALPSFPSAWVGKAHVRTYVPPALLGAEKALAHGLWIDGRPHESLEQAHAQRIARSRERWFPAACLVTLVGIFAWVFYRAWVPAATGHTAVNGRAR